MKGVYDLQLCLIKSLVSCYLRCSGSRKMTCMSLNSHCHLSVIYLLFSPQQPWAFLSDSFKRWLSELSTVSKYSMTSASEYIKFKHTRHFLSTSSGFSSFHASDASCRVRVMSYSAYRRLLKLCSVLLLLRRRGREAARSAAFNACKADAAD